MIVREVIKNPSLIDNFDYFNDSEDTINWLKSIKLESKTAEDKNKIQELINKIEDKTRDYWSNRFKT